jgi:hypothetical protein
MAHSPTSSRSRTTAKPPHQDRRPGRPDLRRTTLPHHHTINRGLEPVRRHDEFYWNVTGNDGPSASSAQAHRHLPGRTRAPGVGRDPAYNLLTDPSDPRAPATRQLSGDGGVLARTARRLRPHHCRRPRRASSPSDRLSSSMPTRRSASR